MGKGTSLPAWECGLKLENYTGLEEGYCVTPCVGVWIEIFLITTAIWSLFVTPCVGVWIEIS